MRTRACSLMVLSLALLSCASNSPETVYARYSSDNPFNKIDSLFHDCRYEDVEAEINQLMQTVNDKDRAIAQAYLADVRWAQGDLRAAAKLYNQSLAGDWYTAEQRMIVLGSLGRVLVLRGAFVDAVPVFKEMLIILSLVQRKKNHSQVISGISGDTFIAMAIALAEAGDFENAVLTIERAVKNESFVNPDWLQLKELIEEARKSDKTPTRGTFSEVFYDKRNLEARRITYVPAKPIKRIAPVYPRDAARDRVQGNVLLELTIGIEGNVSEVRVLKSEPRGVFDFAAKVAVKQWKFTPAILDCQPIEKRGHQRMDFLLKD